MRHPKGLRKLVIASGPASIPLYMEALKGLLAKLPADIRKTLEECDKKGDHESEEFLKAAQVFYSRYVCQLDPMPDEVTTAFKNMKEDPTVYMTM